MRIGDGIQPWFTWTTAGVVAAAVHLALGPDSAAGGTLYAAFSLVAVGVTAYGIRRHRPSNQAGWYLFIAGLAVGLTGDAFYFAYVHIWHEDPWMSWADVLYLGAYPTVAAGLILLSRAGRGRDPAGLIDALILAAGTGLVWWVSVVSPYLSEELPLLEKVATVGYPMVDMLLFGVVVRMLTRRGRNTISTRLLIVATGIMLFSDAYFTYINASAAGADVLSTAGFMLAYTAWGAAALHPSVAAEPEPVADGGERLGRARLILLTASVLLAPAVLFIEGMAGSGGDHWLSIGIAAVLLFLLVIARMSGFVRKVQSQRHELEDLAMRDALTGLANRRRFEEKLRAALAQGRPQVAVLDMTDFKGVNDRFGHAVGDRLLVTVAERLTTYLRDTDVVARMGGDEFAVLVPDAPPGATSGIAGRITSALHHPVDAGGVELLITASVGLADADGTDDPDEVLRRADMAMYAVKEAGGGQVRIYTPDLDRTAGEQARLGAELRTALDHGQFHLLYQPIVALPDGRITGVEALVRWDHPERGLVGPVEFIPVAEQTGLIVELGEWILRTACAQAVAWRDELGDDAPGTMSVNVSARQLAEPRFADLVRTVLTESGLPAPVLLVEVTETAVFGGGRAARTVEDVHALGVRIALDDFGTGHSSLGLLQTVPVDVFKVDKSFVDNITMAGRHAVIATALIQVANGLGLTAIAEGVETAEQAAELHRLGYRRAQGYHFGRPVARPGFGRRLGFAGDSGRGLPAAVGRVLDQ